MMKRTVMVSVVASLFLAVLLTMNAFAEGSAEKSEKAKKEQPEWAVYDEYWVLWVDEPAHHFKLAREDFLNNDRDAAANEIRTGATFLKLEAGRSTDEGKEGLKTSFVELDKLANDIEQGSVTSVKTLDNAFARTHYEFAKNHLLQAKDALEHDDTKLAGQRLKAATTHLESAMAWSGYKEEDVAVEVVKKAETLSDKLIAGAKLAPEEVGKLIEALGKAIEKIGKAVGSVK